MKGTIVKCLEDLVITRFGKETWDKCLADAGFRSPVLILAIEDVDDASVLSLVRALCTNLRLSMVQAADAFGDHWVNVYSQKMYGQYYANSPNAREFLLSMDAVHLAMTNTIKDARPPRFSYEWEDNRTLIIGYQSHRGLIDFAVGLAKAVGKFYKESLVVTKLGPDRFRVIFPK